MNNNQFNNNNSLNNQINNNNSFNQFNNNVNPMDGYNDQININNNNQFINNRNNEKMNTSIQGLNDGSQYSYDQKVMANINEYKEKKKVKKISLTNELIVIIIAGVVLYIGIMLLPQIYDLIQGFFGY